MSHTKPLNTCIADACPLIDKTKSKLLAMFDRCKYYAGNGFCKHEEQQKAVVAPKAEPVKPNQQNQQQLKK